MIKFEEHDGLIFKMLDEPTPLTPETEMPCLVRLIQDDSPMGLHNKDLHGYDPEGLTPKICTEVIDVNDLSDPKRGSVRYDGYISGQYYHFEIIGTLVTEGSAEWALYRLMQGDIVMGQYRGDDVMVTSTSIGWHEVIRVDLYGKRHGIPITDSDFLFHAEKMGWQIYKEPEPLLAEAKVRDLCQRRDGKWVQIDRLLSIGGMPWICYEIGGLRYINNGEQLNSKLSELGIISTEPIAPEGTAEWAWQMLKLQKPVSHPAEGELQDTDYTKEGFVRCMAKTGWQLYEPKPESENIIHDYIPADMRPEYFHLCKFKVGDWVEWRGDQYMVESAPPQSGDRYNIRSPYDELGYSVCPENITRKLDPSEVVIHIGCLSGTVEDLSYAEDGRFWLIGKATERRPVRMFALLYDEMLDTPTRKIVENLIKAQEEEK